MNGSQYFIQSQLVFHGEHIFCDNIRCMGSGYGYAYDFIGSRFCEHFNQPVSFGIGYRAIQVINTICSDFIFNPFFLSILFIQSNTGNFRISISCPWDNTVICFKLFNASKQSINSGIPGLVRCKVGKLVWSCDIAGTENIGEICLEEFVCFDGLSFCNGYTQLFKTKTLDIGGPADRHQNFIKLHADFPSFAGTDECF